MGKELNKYREAYKLPGFRLRISNASFSDYIFSSFIAITLLGDKVSLKKLKIKIKSIIDVLIYITNVLIMILCVNYIRFWLEPEKTF